MHQIVEKRDFFLSIWPDILRIKVKEPYGLTAPSTRKSIVLGLSGEMD